MASRPVYWYEGMFLQPQHLQAADRHAVESLRRSEDWFHPFDWGFRAIDIDRDAVANYDRLVAVVARSGSRTAPSCRSPRTPSRRPGRAARRTPSSASGSVTIYLGRADASR